MRKFPYRGWAMTGREGGEGEGEGGRERGGGREEGRGEGEYLQMSSYLLLFRACIKIQPSQRFFSKHNIYIYSLFM
jgi:hypothetical protein